MSRRKKKAKALQHERELMRGRVRWDGQGEDPAVRAFLQDFSDADHMEAAEISLALDRLLKGDASVLNDPEQAEKLNKIRARAAAMADAERRYEEDKDKFVDKLWQNHEKYKPRGEKLEEVRAQGAKTIQNALMYARANNASKKLRFQEIIKNGPKRKVFVTGNPVVTDKGIVIEPEYINIMGVAMVLGPGEHLIPEPFAQRYEDMKAAREENRARQAALEQNMRADELAKTWSELDTKYGSKTDAGDGGTINLPGVY